MHAEGGWWVRGNILELALAPTDDATGPDSCAEEAGAAAASCATAAGVGPAEASGAAAASCAMAAGVGPAEASGDTCASCWEAAAGAAGSGDARLAEVAPGG